MTDHAELPPLPEFAWAPPSKDIEMLRDWCRAYARQHAASLSARVAELDGQITEWVAHARSFEIANSALAVERDALRVEVARLKEPVSAEPVKGGSMTCEDCDGTGVQGDEIYQGEFQPPERARCSSCDGYGRWAGNFYTESAIRQAQASAAADRVDAERWREIREWHWTDSTFCVARTASLQVGHHCPARAELEQLVDRAIAARQPPPDARPAGTGDSK